MQEQEPASVTRQPPNAMASYGLLGKWFGRVMGTASALNLIHSAFHMGFGPTLQRLINSYEELISRLFRPFEGVFQLALNFLGQLMRLELHLLPYWKHIFVVMLVYFGARLRSMWTTGEQKVRPLMRWTLVAAAVIAAILGSVAAGVIEVHEASGRFLVSLPVALLPLLASLAFALTENVLTSVFRPDFEPGPSRPSAFAVFANLSRKAMSRFLGALLLLVVWIVLASSVIDRVANPGLAGLILLVLLAIPYWLDQGRRTVMRRRLPGETWWRTSWRLGSTRVAIELTVILTFMLVTIVVSAGWDAFA